MSSACCKVFLVCYRPLAEFLTRPWKPPEAPASKLRSARQDFFTSPEFRTRGTSDVLARAGPCQSE